MGNRSDRIRPLTDQEEADIQRQIAEDPDDADSTDAELRQGKPFEEALPALMESIRRSRGRPKSEAPKAAVTLRLDPSTVARFKAKGKDWRALMAEAIEKARI